jgi:hypothetical protein
MSLRQKIRSGRYGLVLVHVHGGVALAARQGENVTAFGDVFQNEDKAQENALLKFGRKAEVHHRNLFNYKVEELKEMAKKMGVKGISKMNKGALITALSQVRAAA